jgi:hypothetical protein
MDPESAKVRGQYVALDAAETLAMFMVDGSPEPQRFNQVIGNVIESVTDGRNNVRAFGEMVAILWAEGNYSAAIKLEELWNALQKNYSFSLFCAYPINGFSGEKFVDQLSGICTAHSRVIPAESSFIRTIGSVPSSGYNRKPRLCRPKFGNAKRLKKNCAFPC